MADDTTLRLGGDPEGAVQAVREVATELRQMTTSSAAQWDALGQKLDTHKTKTDAAKQSTGLFDEQFRRLTAAFTAASLIEKGVTALAGFVTEAINGAGALVDLRAKTGLSLDELQRMGAVLVETGVSVESQATAAFKLSQRLANGSDGVRDGARAVGIEFERLKAMKPEEQWRVVMEAVSKIADPQERNRVGILMFGKSFEQVAASAVTNWKDIRDAAVVAGDAQVEAIDKASDAWSGFLRTLSTGTTQVLGGVVLSISDAASAGDRLAANTDKLTYSQRLYAVMLHQTHGDLGAYLDSILGAAAGTEKATAENVKAAPAVRNYTQEMAAAKRVVDALLPAKRAEILAHKDAGATVEELTDAYGLNAVALKLLESATKDQEAADKKGADEAQRHADERRKFADALFGRDQVTKAQQYITALGGIGNISRLSADKQKELNTAVVAGIDAYRRAGETAPASWQKIAQASTVAGVVQSTYNITLGQYVTQAHLAENATDELYEQLYRLTGEVQRIDGPVTAATFGWVGFKGAVEAVKPKIELTKEELKELALAASRQAAQGLRDLSSALADLAESTGRTDGSVARIAEIIGLMSVSATAGAQFKEAMDAFKNNPTAATIQMATSLVALAAAFQQSTDKAGTFNRQMSAMATGASAGNSIWPGWGGLIGGFVGLLYGTYKDAPEFEKVMREVGGSWGLKISEGLGRAIADDAKNLFGGDRKLAELFNLTEIFAESDMEGNFGPIMTAMLDMFDMVERGAATVDQARTILDKNFGIFAQHLKDSGEIADAAFVLMLERSAQLGIQSKEITAFIQAQVTTIGTGLASQLSTLNATYTDLAPNIDKAKAAVAGLVADGKTGTEAHSKAVAELNLLLAKQKDGATQAGDDIDRVGRLAVAAFNAAIAKGADWNTALANIGPALDSITALQKNLGIESSDAAVQELLRFRQLTEEHAGLFEAASALNEVMIAMSSIGALNADTLADLEAQGLQTFDSLIAAGLTEQQALAQMKGWIKNVDKAHRDLGIPVDENTQKLLDQARAQGILEEEGTSTNDILREGIGALIEALGGELPEAWKKSGDAAKRESERARIAANGVESAVEEVSDRVNNIDWAGMAERATAALEDVEGGVNAVSFGHSPGGLKEYPLLLDKASKSLRGWSRDWKAELAAVEARVNETGLRSLARGVNYGAASALATAGNDTASAAGAVDVHATLQNEMAVYLAVDPMTGAVRQATDAAEIEQIVARGLRTGRIAVPSRNLTGRAA